jgi:CheY-like chemotaxis protein
LFEPFTQTEIGRESQEGTGLGLAISHSFVQLMGGDIEVKSEVGRGTLFKLWIQAEIVSAGQVEERQRQAEQRAVALAPGQARYRILIVDDNWTNRRLLFKILEPLGFELREAENGQEALEIWQGWKPHLIWMDMRMPVLNGYEAARRIKTTSQGQATSVIALTASSFEENRAVTLSAGCDDFLRKPFRETDIFEMINKHLGVQFIYEEPALQPTSPGQKALATDLQVTAETLPSELLTRLKEATELGDMAMVDQVIGEIQPYHPLLAETLTELATNFAYGHILTLLTELEEPMDR